MKKTNGNNFTSKRIMRKKSVKKLGLSPGTVIHIGEKKVKSVKLAVTDYDAQQVQRLEISSLSKLPVKKKGVRWIEIKGLHDTDLLNKIGETFYVHPLVLEDILNTHQRPKIESFDNCLFVIIKMVNYDEKSNKLVKEHIGILLFEDTIFTFQETHHPHFEHIQNRLNNPVGKLRKFAVDYLLYAIIDVIVDHYFVVIEALEDKFESLEDQVMKNPNHTQIEEIHLLKRQIISLRKSVRPLREVVNLLMNEELDLISDKISVYLRDLYDHTIQVIDSLETQRELATGLLDTYLSQISNRMNEVMKVLTIIATIFIPLSFFAGLYGMNFDFMPELHFKWGYFILLAFMIFVFILMISYFKRKKWL